jgi:hypothetical protein
MRNFLKIVVISVFLITLQTPVQAKEDITEELRDVVQEGEVVLAEEDAVDTNSEPIQEISEDVSDNTELDFEIFKIFDSEREVNEDSLLGKVLHSKITRTDITTFLLQDDLTFDYEHGPISKIHAYGAYRGAVKSLWSPHYSTEYENLVTQFGVYGSFRNPEYKFKVALNPVPLSGVNYVDRLLTDAYVMNSAIPHHNIIAGYSRVQTGVEGGTSTYILPFVARSQIARNFGSARSLAVKLMGNYQYVDYNIAFGSAGRYITSGVPGLEFNGWVNFKPLGNKSQKYGKVIIGGGFNGGHNRIDYSVASAYLAYHHKKLWANFEAGIADGYSGSNGISSNKACGYAATVGWKLNPHWQILGRVDQFDGNRRVSGDLKREYTIGVNWFVKGQALKVILNYVFCNNQNQPNGHKIILATQIVL